MDRTRLWNVVAPLPAVAAVLAALIADGALRGAAVAIVPLVAAPAFAAATLVFMRRGRR